MIKHEKFYIEITTDIELKQTRDSCTGGVTSRQKLNLKLKLTKPIVIVIRPTRDWKIFKNRVQWRISLRICITVEESRWRTYLNCATCINETVEDDYAAYQLIYIQTLLLIKHKKNKCQTHLRFDRNIAVYISTYSCLQNWSI